MRNRLKYMQYIQPYYMYYHQRNLIQLENLLQLSHFNINNITNLEEKKPDEDTLSRFPENIKEYNKTDMLKYFQQ